MMNSLQKFAKKNKLILVAIILMMVFFLMKTYETFVNLDRYSNYYYLSNDKKKKSLKDTDSNKSCNLLHKSHANKCYDCEDELANTDRSYQSQKTKCFSCEEDLKTRFGSETAFKGQPSKCFDCEAQLSGKKSKSKSK